MSLPISCCVGFQSTVDSIPPGLPLSSPGELVCLVDNIPSCTKRLKRPMVVHPRPTFPASFLSILITKPVRLEESVEGKSFGFRRPFGFLSNPLSPTGTIPLPLPCSLVSDTSTAIRDPSAVSPLSRWPPSNFRVARRPCKFLPRSPSKPALPERSPPQIRSQGPSRERIL